MKKAIYAGTFDPVTNGHLDIIKRSLTIFDELVILISINNDKNPTFSNGVRIQMLKDATKSLKGITIDSSDMLTSEYAKKHGINFLVRGIRNTTDFETEKKLAYYNHEFNDSLETVLLLASEEYAFVSSGAVRELIKFKKDTSKYTPLNVLDYLD